MTATFYKKLLGWLSNNKEIKFYKSSQWRKARATVIKRDNYECQWCKGKGRFSPAEHVHHIVELKSNPTLALDARNLVTLCKACHNAAHPDKFPEPEPRFTTEERW